MDICYSFTSSLWVYQGKAAWYFVNVPCDVAMAIKHVSKSFTGGFGSVKVHVKLGNSAWDTSIFPDSKRQTYLLPIKAAIRKQENITVGDEVECVVRLPVG
jgi:Domain of unknown function (DUF1905)